MRLGLLIFGLLLHINVIAQTCLSTAEETAPEENFIENGDGTVTDITTGLMWMQCSVGQIWSVGGCSGDPSELNWQQALQFAHGLQYADFDGWRIPNMKELATIAERNCVRPSINEDIFPATPSDDFWTSTPSVTDPERAWVIAFFNSSNSLKDKDLFVFTRLVRTVD